MKGFYPVVISSWNYLTGSREDIIPMLSVDNEFKVNPMDTTWNDVSTFILQQLESIDMDYYSILALSLLSIILALKTLKINSKTKRVKHRHTSRRSKVENLNRRVLVDSRTQTDGTLLLSFDEEPIVLTLGKQAPSISTSSTTSTGFLPLLISGTDLSLNAEVVYSEPFHY